MKHILPIPALKDNYIWTMHNENQAWVVDPGDADPVIDYFKKQNWKLSGILITHHHGDHTAGINGLLENFGEVPVYASTQSSNPYVTHKLKQDDELQCLTIKFSAIEIPGHTLDHMAYYGNKMLFCGDTLFSAGCGRIFEGTPNQMYASLQKITQLPDTTEIYCGHEYTLANLKFAETVEPSNHAIAAKMKIAQQGGCTLPSILKEERMINPFLRCHIPDVIKAVENYAGTSLGNEVDVFTHLRAWKNSF